MLRTVVVCFWRCIVIRFLWFSLLFSSACQRQVAQQLVSEEPIDWLLEQHAATPTASGFVEEVVPIDHGGTACEVTDELEEQLQVLTQQKHLAGHIEVYTIQLCADVNRDVVMQAAALLGADEVVEDRVLDVRVVYDQPRYKLQVGIFYDYLAAHEVFTHFVDDYPLGMIVFKETPLPPPQQEE